MGPRVHASSPVGTVAHPPAGRGRHRTAAAPQRPLSPATQPARRVTPPQIPPRGQRRPNLHKEQNGAGGRPASFGSKQLWWRGPARMARDGSAAGGLVTSVRLPLPASETTKGDGQLLGGLPAGSGAPGGRGE